MNVTVLVVVLGAELTMVLRTSIVQDAAGAKTVEYTGAEGGGEEDREG